MDAATDYRFERIASPGEAAGTDRAIAVEAPVAIEIDGIGYAVLMATPADLDNLTTGFLLSERLADTVDDVVDVDVHYHPAGWIVRAALSERTRGLVTEQVRHRTSESSCGLCGVENLEQAMRPLPMVRDPFAGSIAAVFAALARLRDHQPLNAATGAVHAAALCDATGAIQLVRADVGRHNAFDKLIGAMAREEQSWDAGFALLTSRCSYELVEKAALSGCPLLATISAPTTLALARASEAGLPLVSLARSDALLLAR